MSNDKLLNPKYVSDALDVVLGHDWEDTALIECDACKAALNGKSLWVVGEGDEAITLCDNCYAARIQE